jgi:shikimate dehydrogenase
VLILGAGGAGRAIAIQCAIDGAAKVIVANRTPGRLPDTIPLDAKSLAGVIGQVDLLVNATSVGLKPGETLPLTREMLRPELAVYDTIYRPAETELIRLAADAGSKVANGLSMLLHQGVKAFEIWTKRKAPLAVMRRALRAAVYGEHA